MTHIEKLPRAFLRHPPPEPAQMREDELDALAIFRVIRRNAVLIISAFVLLTTLAIPSILALDRSYYAEARLLIRVPLTASLSAPRPEGYGELNLSTEVARIVTRENAEELIDAFAMRDLAEFNPRLRNEPLLTRMTGNARSWLRDVTGASASPDIPATEIAEIDLVIPEFFRALSVGQMSNVVSIGFSSGDPELAAAVPNKLVTTYLDARDRQLREDMRTAEQWLAARISEQQHRLTLAEELVTSYRLSDGLLSDDARADSTKTISAFLARRADITTLRAQLTAQIATLEAAGTDDISGPDDGDALARLRGDLRAQRRALTQLLPGYGEGSASVVETKARILELEAAVNGETARTIRMMRGQSQALDREEAALLGKLAEERIVLAQTNALETHLEGLLRAVATERNALDALYLQSRALETQGQVPAAEVEILSPATVPLAPSGRSRSFYLLAAMIGAAALALTLALMHEALDSGIRGFPQLAGIPAVTPGGLIPTLARRRRRFKARTDWLRSDGMFNESLRGLMLALDLTESGGAGGVVVSSALPDEGKSTVAAGLALELRAAGRRPLLVDADTRHGALHQFFGLESEPGLRDLLRGECTIEDAIQRHPDSGLEFIARGSRRCAPLLDAKRALRLFEHARANGQVLIIDTAPVLATTETSMLTRLAEQSLLVARWGSTRVRDIELAAARFHTSNARPVVVALNMVDPSRYVLYGFKDAGVFSRSLRKYYQS